MFLSVPAYGLQPVVCNLACTCRRVPADGKHSVRDIVDGLILRLPHFFILHPLHSYSVTTPARKSAMKFSTTTRPQPP